MAAITAILRDHSGKIVEGQSSIVHDTSVLQCEVHAIRLAGSLIQANNLSQITIESDNKLAIHLCSTESVPPWVYATIMKV